MARQQHGFQYEAEVIARYGLKRTGYTDKYDAYAGALPVQIKCIKWKSSIDMGDFARNVSHDEDFILHVGFWEGRKDHIKVEYSLMIDHVIWGNELQFKHTDEMLGELKGISNRPEDDVRWADFRKKYGELYGARNVMLRFKRDSKSQRRIQCAIPFGNFMGHFVNNYIAAKIGPDLTYMFYRPSKWGTISIIPGPKAVIGNIDGALTITPFLPIGAFVDAANVVFATKTGEVFDLLNLASGVVYCNAVTSKGPTLEAIEYMQNCHIKSSRATWDIIKKAKMINRAIEFIRGKLD